MHITQHKHNEEDVQSMKSVDISEILLNKIIYETLWAMWSSASPDVAFTCCKCLYVRA